MNLFTRTDGGLGRRSFPDRSPLSRAYARVVSPKEPYHRDVRGEIGFVSRQSSSPPPSDKAIQREARSIPTLTGLDVF